MCLPMVALFASVLAAQRMDLVFAATTDVHGRIRGWDYYANAPDPARSLAGAATIVDSVRAANPGRVFLVDGGDLLQGNPLLFVAAKIAPPPVHPVIAAMNVMRYDAAVLGNHEFNYGVPALRAAISRAAFPFLAANVSDADGIPFVAPYVLVDRGKVRVAIIGATTPGSMLWDRENLKAADLRVSDIVGSVRAAVAAVRKQKASVVVVLLHSGLNEAATYDTIATGLPSENVSARVPREIDGIDLVVYGHSHRELVDSTINGALLVQPRNWAASVAIATLTIEKAKGAWRVVSHRGQSVSVAGHRESPAVLAASAGTHRATVQWVTTPVGRTDAVWRSDSARVVDAPISDFVNEVMRRAAGAELSATAVFSLNAKLDSGAVTQAALSRLYPYDNTLRSVRVSGAQLRAFLEHSSLYYRTLPTDGSVPPGGLVNPRVPGFNFDLVTGVDYVIDLRRPPGSRITSLSRNGRAVQDSDSFTMALNSYRQSGGGGYSMLASAPVVFQQEADIRQLLIDEVVRVSANGGRLRTTDYASSNWRLEPAEAVAMAHAEQRREGAAEATSAGARPPATSESAPAEAAGMPTRAAATGQRRVRVIAMGDLHGAMRARADDRGVRMGGAIALSAAIRRAENECVLPCQSIVVDAGDLFTGTPASDWDAGRPTVAVANRLHIAAGALGNHEFDFGQDTLRQRRSELRHALLGVNVRDRSGRMPSFVRADTMVTRGGVKIGIVGAAGAHTAGSTKARNIRDLVFLDPAPLLSERVRALRAAGAAVVIGVIHDGARCERERPTVCRGDGLEVAEQLTDRPDVLVLGHSHVNLVTSVRGMPVVEAASSGRGIAVVDLPLDGAEARGFTRDVFGDSIAGADSVVDAVVNAAVANVRARVERQVAVIAEPLRRRGGQYALGNLIADAARRVANTDFAVWNNGGIRADLEAGPLSFGGVHEVLPFGNVLVRLRMTGREVARYMERALLRGGPDAHVSGMLVDFDSTAVAGRRVRHVRMANGRLIRPTQIYTMVINDFMFEEPDQTYLTSRSHQILSTRDVDLLAQYLRSLPQPVRASEEARIRPVAPGRVR